MNICFKQSYGCPCKTDTFVINGIEASVADFGYMANDYEVSDNDTDCEWYEETDSSFCFYMRFFPDTSEEAMENAIKKYGIDDSEFRGIQALLVSLMEIGGCSMCL